MEEENSFILWVMTLASGCSFSMEDALTESETAFIMQLVNANS